MNDIYALNTLNSNIWLSKSRQKYLILHVRETHVGKRYSIKFTDNVALATYSRCLPHGINKRTRQDAEPIPVRVVTSITPDPEPTPSQKWQIWTQDLENGPKYHGEYDGPTFSRACVNFLAVAPEYKGVRFYRSQLEAGATWRAN